MSNKSVAQGLLNIAALSAVKVPLLVLIYLGYRLILSFNISEIFSKKL